MPISLQYCGEVTDVMLDSYRAGCGVHGQCEVASKVANIKLYLKAIQHLYLFIF